MTGRVQATKIILVCVIATLISHSLAAYTIVDDYDAGHFADMFDFFTEDDPTHGYVDYVNESTAVSSGLLQINSEQVYIGVDAENIASGRGRSSVRISSKNSYQHGLIILDLEHMPGGQCGTWPAFWLLSSNSTWPAGGEIDIIEGVNSQIQNSMTVHTDAGCSISNMGNMSGIIETLNCNVNAPNQETNQGCSIQANTSVTFGTGFNAAGGGVYATEWTSQGISVFFFPRTAIPSDIASGSPDPSEWGPPVARFAGACDWDEHVYSQQIIFDVTFCGDWAGGVWAQDPMCSTQATTCQSYVQNNPADFRETYWLINSLKVYQNSEPFTSSTSLKLPQSTFVSSYRASATRDIPATTLPMESRQTGLEVAQFPLRVSQDKRDVNDRTTDSRTGKRRFGTV